MPSGSSKQQVIQNIKDATNILVTVNANPSVDELSAALGLTIFLNKLDKHATAVFSGDVPPVMDFLNPDATFEQTTDSLRDFIIALDKEKADHLRYKVVDDAVKIFITPYRTTINEKDLEFSQGDYNVEMVLALNVDNSDHIDAALSAHGKILHDATVATVTAGSVKSGLGSIDWHEDNTSGVSEMVVELIDGLKTPKVALDEQMATALLTGIVAATERFSNDLTSSRVMTAAAELMAAGANQQLVVSKMDEGKQVAAEKESEAPEDEAKDAEDKTDEAAESTEDKAQADGSLSISHDTKSEVDKAADRVAKESQEASARLAEDRLTKITPTEAEEPEEATTPEPAEVKLPEVSLPSIGGTLNATTEQAAEDKKRDLQRDQNRTILKHGEYIGATPPSFGDTPLNAAMGESDEPPKIDPFAKINNDTTAALPGLEANSSPAVAPENEEIMAALADDTKQLAMPAAEAPVPDVAELTTPNAAAPAPVGMPTSAPTLTDIETTASTGGLPPVPPPPMPPLPDFSTLPTLPPAPVGVDAGGLPTLPNLEPTPVPPVAAAPEPTATNPNPGQFQIPGQS